MKKLIFLICFAITSLNASYLNKGVIMCSSREAAAEIVKLGEKMNVDLLDYFDKMEREGICTTTVMKMNLDFLNRIDLSNGVTSIYQSGRTYYILTQEISDY